MRDTGEANATTSTIAASKQVLSCYIAPTSVEYVLLASLFYLLFGAADSSSASASTSVETTLAAIDLISYVCMISCETDGDNQSTGTGSGGGGGVVVNLDKATREAVRALAGKYRCVIMEALIPYCRANTTTLTTTTALADKCINPSQQNGDTLLAMNISALAALSRALCVPLQHSSVLESLALATALAWNTANASSATRAVDVPLTELQRQSVHPLAERVENTLANAEKADKELAGTGLAFAKNVASLFTIDEPCLVQRLRVPYGEWMSRSWRFALIPLSSHLILVVYLTPDGW